MTPEQKRIAIAERCGWSKLESGGWRRPDGSIQNQNYGEEWRLPPYTTSIDAIREAVLAQSEEFQDEFDTFINNWMCETENEFYHQLTALDWCDCFLAADKQINKKVT